MKIKFTTQIDVYQRDCFPEIDYGVPRIGDSIPVRKVFKSYFQDKRLPTILQVVDVTWTEDCVICELHYKDIDIKFAKLNGVNLYP